MDYGEVLSKAWKVIWKHKVLWIFGILASFGQGSGGGSGGGGNSRISGGGNSSGFGNLPPEWTRILENVQHYIENVHWWVWVLFALAIILLIIFFAVLATIGKTGLILGAQRADKNDEKIPFGLLLRDSMHYFWKVFWFNFLSGLAVVIVILAFMLPLILLGVVTAGVGMLCLIPFICILVPVSWLISILFEQSIIAIVVEGTGIFAGLKRGWQVVKKNPWQLILMSLILGIGGGIINFILAIPVFLAMLPVIITLFTGSMDSLKTTGIITLSLCCVYLPVLYLLSGILTAYIQSVWTLTFLRLTEKTPEETLDRVEVLPEVPPSV
jgi:hypothetical protein